MAEEDLLLDVATVVARVEQLDREGAPDHWLWERIVTCDLPRLRMHLAARPELVADLDRKALGGDSTQAHNPYAAEAPGA